MPIAAQHVPLAQFRDDPVGFVANVLPNAGAPYPKQIEMMELVAKERRTSVVGCHASGKDWATARVILWWLETRPHAKVVVIAPTQRQMEQILWQELATAVANADVPLSGKLTKSRYTISPDRFAIAFATDKPENIQGFHSPELLLIIDEAHGVKQSHLDAARRLNPVKTLMVGNALPQPGDFYDSHHSKRRYYSCLKIAAADTPNLQDGAERVPGLISQDDIDDKILAWGESPPLPLRRLRRLSRLRARLPRGPQGDRGRDGRRRPVRRRRSYGVGGRARARLRRRGRGPIRRGQVRVGRKAGPARRRNQVAGAPNGHDARRGRGRADGQRLGRGGDLRGRERRRRGRVRPPEGGRRARLRRAIRTQSAAPDEIRQPALRDLLGVAAPDERPPDRLAQRRGTRRATPLFALRGVEFRPSRLGEQADDAQARRPLPRPRRRPRLGVYAPAVPPNLDGLRALPPLPAPPRRPPPPTPQPR